MRGFMNQKDNNPPKSRKIMMSLSSDSPDRKELLGLMHGTFKEIMERSLPIPQNLMTDFFATAGMLDRTDPHFEEDAVHLASCVAVSFDGIGPHLEVEIDHLKHYNGTYTRWYKQ